MVFSVVDRPAKLDKKKLTAKKKDALKSILTLENKKKQDVFLETRQKTMQIKRDNELKDLRKSVNFEETEIRDEIDDMCCQQCNTPVPLVCWRFSIKYFLQSTQL
jgi:hypothetical protein